MPCRASAALPRRSLHQPPKPGARATSGAAKLHPRGKARPCARQSGPPGTHTTHHKSEIPPSSSATVSAAGRWGFAVYLASRDGYEDALLPSGLPIGSPEEALDCACGLYLADPSAWQEHLPPGGS